MAEKLAPWEQEEVRTATHNPGAAAPWEDEPSLHGPKVLQEMHPEFGVGSRLLLKNFANSPEAMVAYLKKKHPGMDIQVHRGQVIGKLPGEAEYKTLDPNPSLLAEPLQFAKDLPLDVADVGTDVGQGIASTVASGAAGAAGAAATLPAGGVGALPAAAVAGGTTNAALEAIKQKVGQLMGIPQEVDPTQVAFAGGAGAVSPLLFGSGATANQIAKAGQNLTSEQVRQLAAAQKGGVSRAWDYAKNTAAPAIGEYFSGVPAEVIKERAKNPEKLMALKDEGITDYLEGVHERVRQGLASRKVAVGQALEKEIGEAGVPVNLARTKKIINDHIKNLENSELKDNPLIKQQIAELKAARDEMLTEVTETVTKEPVMTASKLLGPDGKPVMRQTGVKDVVEQTVSEIPDQVSAKKAFELQALLKDQAELTKLTQGTTSRFSKGATGGEKAWAEANRRAYNTINEELDTATAGMSDALKKQYREYAQLQQDLKNRFADPEKTYATLSGIHGKGKQVLRERLQGVAEMTRGQVNPLEDAKTLAAFKYFVDKPSRNPISTGGTTSTSRSLGLRTLGGAIGYKAAPIFGVAPHTGMAAGIVTGDYLGSPQAINHYINAFRGAQDFMEPMMTRMPAPAAPAGALSIWEMMKSQQPLENPYEQKY